METHKYKQGKFPVADQVIYYFNNLLFDHIDSNFWIAGGCITSFLSGDKVNDIDCFVNTRSNACKLIVELRKKFEFKAYLITPNAIKGIATIKGKSIKIDIVKNVFDNPLSTIENFDFTVVCFSTDGDRFYYHSKAAFDLLRRKLVINNTTHPVDSVRRLQKYVKRGFSACNGTVLELAEAIRKLTPEEMEIVEFYPID
jgi:hypothetical protein